MTNPSAPPELLSAESRKLWRSVPADYELAQRYEAVVQTTLEALDRICQARAQLAADGLPTVDRYGGVKAHPCVFTERESRTA